MLTSRFFVLFFCVFLVNSAPQMNPSCRTPRNGNCISITLCPHYMNQITSIARPRNLLTDVRKNLCGMIYQTPKVCCPLTKNDKPDTIEDHQNFHLLPTECGPISHGTRIVNGANASPREFPWMALIAYQTGDAPDEQDFKCGGSLISERYILTAAHCLFEKTLLGVRLGEYDISVEKECYNNGKSCEPPVQDILIDKIKIHEKYNPSTHQNDIALIRLSTPANTEIDSVKPICLPIGYLLKANLLGKFLTVTGWGTTETGHKSMVLHKASIPIVPLKDCRKLYGKFTIISKTQICAGGYKGRDSCSGDSGGPLQYIAKVGEAQKYVQDGIVSYGPKQCGIAGWPGVYTNVKEYMSWILDNIEP